MGKLAGWCVVLCAVGCSSNNGASTDAPPGTGPDGPVVDASQGGGPDANGGITVGAPIALDGSVLTGVRDHTTKRLYVSMTDGIGGGDGIAVIDTTNDSVVTTISGPTSGQVERIDAMAVDETAGKVYVASSQDRYIWAIDESNNTLSTKLDVNPANPGVITNVIGLKVDAAKHQLYAALTYTAGDSAIQIVDTSAFTLGTTTVVTGLANAEALAYDAVNHLLFACGSTTAHEGYADSFDTSTGTLTTTSIDLGPDHGSLDACLDGPGNAFAVMGGATGTVWALEPAEVDLDITPTSYAVNPTPLPSGEIEVVFFGHDVINDSFVQVVRFGAHEPAVATKDPRVNVNGDDDFTGVFGMGFETNLKMDGYAVVDIKANDAGAQKGELVHAAINLPTN